MIVSLALVTVLASAAPVSPDTRYDPAVPTLKDVVGHELGERISTPDQIVRYFKALAAAVPDRTQLVTYATSEEGRPLVVLAVGSAERMTRLEEVQAGLARLADPRGLDEAEAEAEDLVREMPAVVWLFHAVHGNEISGPGAAQALAHHLLAAQDDDTVDLVRRHAIVLIDPLQNPDGRARFLASNGLARALVPDPDPLAAEHVEPWPGGRANHYLFDLNRDWFAQTQPETRGKLEVFQDWYPHVAVDLHEMGGDATYFFAPPAAPRNPHLVASQDEWHDRIGRAVAARFDERGEPYFVREVFDAFYPGYGETWPMLHGAVGMTYEQASARGLVFRRVDDTELTYLHGIRNHFTAALATSAAAAEGRETLLRDYLAYRRSAVTDGQRGAVQSYVLLEGEDPARARRLAELLVGQDIDVLVAEEPIQSRERAFPPGSYVVPLAQPAGRLVRNLLDPDVPMDDAFIAEQERRRKKRIRDQIYDVTAWSLPLVFDVESVGVSGALLGSTTPWSPQAPETSELAEAQVAWLLPWGAGTAAAVAEALQAGVRMRVTDGGTTIGTTSFRRGSVIVRASENPPDARDTLARLVARHHTTATAVDSGYPERGVSLGSRRVRPLKAPRVLLAWDTPTSSLSAGWARWVLERRYGQPVTIVRVSTLRFADLDRYDVVILPSGTYGSAIGGPLLGRLKSWIREGGTLVALGEASRWLTSDDVELLSTTTELRGGCPDEDGPDEEKAGKSRPCGQSDDEGYDLESAIKPDRERPDAVPGALLRVDLDEEHWLSSGTDGRVQAIVESRRVFSPLKLDKGRNVGVYSSEEEVVASGYVWDESRAQLAQKAFLMHQPLGRGHVVAFAEDPNYRGYAEATELLFMNAVLLGPAY